MLALRICERTPAYRGGGTFTVSQEAEYDAMIEKLEREIEKNYLEWSEKGDAMRGE